MGYAITRQGNDSTYNLVYLIIDSYSELSSVPTSFAIGTIAFIVDTQDKYMLNTSKQWVKIEI